jgi:hypothetical protein
MLRTTMAKAYIKRTFRPLYGWTQMTPKSVFLDPAWSMTDRVNHPAWPGMVYMKMQGEKVRLFGDDGSGGVSDATPYGFGALYVGGDGIDEPLDSGINAFAVWVLSPDAEAEVLAPAFDTSESWVESGDGSEDLIYVGTSSTPQGNRGKLVPESTSGGDRSSVPVARLLKVNSSTKITIGGLR